MSYWWLAAMWGLSAFALRRARRIWRDPSYFEATAAQRSFQLFGKQHQRDMLRGWVPFSISATGLAAALTLMAIGESVKPASRAYLPFLLLGLGFFLVFLVFFALQYTIAYSNSPSGLVPPYLRDEQGILGRRERRRRIRP